MYEQAPQIYNQDLQQGLQSQFQLATQAQPVSQFLAGLRQAQMQKMQQEQLDRQNAIQQETMRHNLDTEDIAQQNQNRYISELNRKQNMDDINSGYKFQHGLDNSAVPDPSAQSAVDALNAHFEKSNNPFRVKIPATMVGRAGTPETSTVTPGSFTDLFNKQTPDNPIYGPPDTESDTTVTPATPDFMVNANKAGTNLKKEMDLADIRNKRVALEGERNAIKSREVNGKLGSWADLKRLREIEGTLKTTQSQELIKMGEARRERLDYQNQLTADQDTELLPSQVNKNNSVSNMEDRKFLPGQPRYMSAGEQKALATLKATPGANVKQFIADLKNKGVIVVAE